MTSHGFLQRAWIRQAVLLAAAALALAVMLAACADDDAAVTDDDADEVAADDADDAAADEADEADEPDDAEPDDEPGPALDEPVTVTVGMTPFYDYQFYAVAKELGWDEELGLELEFEWFSQSGPSIEALARGDIDTVNTCVVCNYPFYESVPELRNFLTVNQFKGFSVIGRTGDSRTYDDFLDELGDPEEAQQATIEQLVDSTVPMYEANYRSLLSATLDQADLTTDVVDIVNFAEDDRAAVAFLGGEGDFYLGGLPSQVNILLEHGDDYHIVGGAEVLGPAGLWYSQVASSDEWLEENRDAALRIMAMSYRYNRYIAEQPEDVLPIVGETIEEQGGPETTPEELELIFDDFLEFRSYQDEAETTYNPDSDLYWRESAEFYVEESDELPEDADYETQNPLEPWFERFLEEDALLEWVDAPL